MATRQHKRFAINVSERVYTELERECERKGKSGRIARGQLRKRAEALIVAALDSEA